jgi:hypothetical protein
VKAIMTVALLLPLALAGCVANDPTPTTQQLLEQVNKDPAVIEARRKRKAECDRLYQINNAYYNPPISSCTNVPPQ